MIAIFVSRQLIRYLKHQYLSTGDDSTCSSGFIFLVLFLGRSIQSFRHLEHQNLSNISDSLDWAGWCNNSLLSSFTIPFTILCTILYNLDKLYSVFHTVPNYVLYYVIFAVQYFLLLSALYSLLYFESDSVLYFIAYFLKTLYYTPLFPVIWKVL